jgi:hypothetical protein
VSSRKFLFTVFWRETKYSFVTKDLLIFFVFCFCFSEQAFIEAQTAKGDPRNESSRRSFIIPSNNRKVRIFKFNSDTVTLSLTCCLL